MNYKVNKLYLISTAILGFSISFLNYSCKDNSEKLDNQDFLNTPDTQQSYPIELDQNAFDYLPKFSTHQIVKHKHYTLSYNEEYEQAEWVAYRLTKNNSIQNNFKRPFFIQDDAVLTSSADWKNYKNSSYDKGHLCPAGDMKFSKKAFHDTFYTSNISPQLHAFNSGVWNRLEQKVRYWSTKYDNLYVITGGVLQKGLKTIGKEKVAVPKYFYKIIVYKIDDEFKMIGFLIPHQESELPLYKFVVAVDKIEELTNIDFFPKLNDTIENRLEKSSDYMDWSFN